MRATRTGTLRCATRRARRGAARRGAAQRVRAPPLTRLLPLSHAACSYRYLPIVQWLLSQGADANIRDADGDTPLMACEDPACADALVAAGADADATNAEGATAYFIATWEGRAEMVTWARARWAARGERAPDVPPAPDTFEAVLEGDEMDDGEAPPADGAAAGVAAE